MAEWARAIGTGWVPDGPVTGPDVDEFADASEITAALAAEPGDSLLAVQHPHRRPGAASLREALPAARAMLDRLRERDYRRVREVVAPYRIAGRDGTAAGVLCLVDPSAVGARIRHSEEVYAGVVAERAAALRALGCATSAAMLVPVTGDGLTRAALAAMRGDPAVDLTDGAGRSHRLWLTGPGHEQDRLLAAPLLVADGNHRVAAAAEAGTPLLALVTAGPDLRIGAIHRTISGTGLGARELAAAWRAAGLTVREVSEVDAIEPGSVAVSARGGELLVALPGDGPDHAVVENLLLDRALGLDPEGPHVHALPEGHSPGPGTDAVLRLAPVPLSEVLAAHEQGRRMPRKSTYFTPKPRSGLLLAALEA
ncbi:DUF1015 family protein [Amycolatopsis thermoflava]|uniref:Uncharacterized protein (DUF1015 family) n=1 Tax=Amycolatopsis thermoflava TaxID=84480 RepID=A0A3N2H7F6_9PSEU|nr:DUF1015 family protein [Amycolatopsis thermoflava]ROS44838.1 uncharacterized protein (DUF1015 family) [Amycolatopsis thermoflava]